jgi:hypothetical protein
MGEITIHITTPDDVEVAPPVNNVIRESTKTIGPPIAETDDRQATLREVIQRIDVIIAAKGTIKPVELMAIKRKLERLL